MKQTNHTDITIEIVKEFAPLVDDVTDPFYEEDSSVYEMLKANIFMVLHKALSRQREEIVAEMVTKCNQLKKDMKNKHACIYNDGEQNCECYLEAIDEFNKKLDELK